MLFAYTCFKTKGNARAKMFCWILFLYFTEIKTETGMGTPA